MGSAVAKKPAAVESKLTDDDKKAAAKKKRDDAKVARTPYRTDEAPKIGAASEVSYDPKTQFTPKRADFEHEHDFFEWKALGADKAATAFRELAEEARTMGSKTDRAKARKLKKYMSEAASLKAELIAEVGEDKVAELLKQMQGK